MSSPRIVSRWWSAAAVLTAVALAAPSAAHADLPDVEAGILGGTGVGSKADGSPYKIVLGAEAALIVASVYVGVRYLHTWSELPDVCTTDCQRVGDLNSLGVDLGYDLELWLLHLSPRLGIGWTADTGADDTVRNAYLDPGAAAAIEVGWFLVGIDVRYRVVIGASEGNSGIALGKIGLRI